MNCKNCNDIPSGCVVCSPDAFPAASAGYLVPFDKWWDSQPEWFKQLANETSHQKAFIAGMLAAAEVAMQPQPSTTTFCCLSTLSKLAEEIRATTKR